MAVYSNRFEQRQNTKPRTISLIETWFHDVHRDLCSGKPYEASLEDSKKAAWTFPRPRINEKLAILCKGYTLLTESGIPKYGHWKCRSNPYLHKRFQAL